MARINENALAKEVCAREGGKVNCTIAQVKDVLKAALDALAEQLADGTVKPSDVLALVERHGC